MKKKFILLLLILCIVPILTTAQGLVPCGQEGKPRCELNDVFILLFNIYDFLVFYVSTPLAGLGIVIGGVILLTSAGNPGLASLAKRVIWGAIIGWLLIWCSWLIIRAVCLSIGLSC
jgi:hypothetical protein